MDKLAAAICILEDLERQGIIHSFDLEFDLRTNTGKLLVKPVKAVKYIHIPIHIFGLQE